MVTGISNNYVKITRKREQKNKKNYTEETAYMITSLSSSASAEMLLDLNRTHWSCENNLNWIKDKVFMEDKSTIRKDNAPIVVSLLRSFVISIISTISAKITETREHFSHYKKSVYSLFCNLRL